MARRTNRYRIGEKSTDIRVGYLGGQPALIANWGGRKYGALLSLTGSGNSSRDSNFGNIRVKGDAVFDSGASVLKITGGGILIKDTSSDKTLHLINSADNILIGNIDTGNELTVDSTNSVENIAVGTDVMKNAEFGSYNVFMGYQAAENFADDCASGNKTTVQGNVAMGYKAFRGVDTTNVRGNYNIAIGFQSMEDWAGTGNGNTCIGYRTGESLTGTYNTLIGYNAGYNSGSENLISGTHNVCIGLSARTNANNDVDAISIGRNAKAGDEAIAIGETPLASGAQSIAIGEGAQATAAAAISIGDGSTSSAADGIAIGRGNTVDDANAIAIGYSNAIAGDHTKSIVIGDDCSTEGEASYVIGFSLAIGAVDNVVVIGGNAGSSGEYAIMDYTSGSPAWTSGSDRRLKKNIVNEGIGLDFINDLKPCTFNFKAPSEMDNDFDGYNKDNNKPKTDKKQYGLIAQDVKKSIDKYGASDYFDMWSLMLNTDIQGLANEKLVMPLLKAVQELSEKLDSIDTRLTNLEAA